MLQTSSRPRAPETSRTGHFVRFYDEDAFLLEEVGEFLESALCAGGVGIVIAAEEHLTVLQRRLSVFRCATGPDQLGPGQWLALDAQATLNRFMQQGWPDEARFLESVGACVARAAAIGAPVHAFGEMVALLCAQGNFQAAIRLEELWNALVKKYEFHLFCAYPFRLFNDADHIVAFQKVCGAHHHVCASEQLSLTREPADLHRLVAMWQQRANALEIEVARRQAAEKALHHREKELADFVENAAEGLHRVAGDGTILWANRAELEMLGYHRDEYVGHHLSKFHVDPDVLNSILATLNAGGTLRDQPARLRCKDGSIKQVLIHSNACFEDGKLAYTRCFTRDATDRVARQEAEARLRRVLTHAPVAAALLVGAEHVFGLANERYCEMVGCDDLVGKTLAEALPQWDRSDLGRELHRVYVTGERFSAEEYLLERGTGEERFFKFNLEPLRADDGTVDGVILIAVDVTEQVGNRRRLERAYAERERLLAELQEASRAKDEFLAMLGHELRNPLSPIVTALQLMRMRGDTGTSREQAIIQRQLDHLVRLVDDLLDISKVARGKIELKQERVRISDVLNKAVEMSSPLLEQRGHRLSVSIDDRLYVQGDSVRLAQVVSNLMTNAARYTDVGGDIRLSASRSSDESVVISVKDNGQGISAEMLPRIFDIFFQGARDIARVEGGLGIGLALVKSFVLLHGGTVSAQSEGPGHGSEFTIRLPIAFGEVPDSAKEDRPDSEMLVQPSGSCGLRVLLVDDNVDAAESLGHLLRAYGHDVRIAHDPAEGLRHIESFTPEVAILDIGLPAMDGYTLAARMREYRDLAACRFVALTGYGQEVDRIRSEAAGFDLHLVKPVPPQLVLDFVQRDCSMASEP
ncbi:ATP-binding protein [Eleftheria terrae]|uniref:ATP-binding protein n=1 Tax=Eleftheria terrae TaxID=1597781 RepID=UPI00263ADF19|nr:ATP-binding protein [Eleftheria terrae]WKB50737.1 PAS domain-containing protein [Eleftheria terrae]